MLVRWQDAAGSAAGTASEYAAAGTDKAAQYAAAGKDAAYDAAGVHILRAWALSGVTY